MLETVEKTSVLPPAFPSRDSLPDFVLPDVLPTDSAALTTLLFAAVQTQTAIRRATQDYISCAIANAKEEALAEAKEEYETRLRELYEQITLMRRRMFGASTECAAQFHLFNEAEILAATATEAQDVVPLPAPALIKPQIPARGKRSPLPQELERVEIIHDVPEAERLCECGTPRVVINRVVSEQLDIIPVRGSFPHSHRPGGYAVARALASGRCRAVR